MRGRDLNAGQKSGPTHNNRIYQNVRDVKLSPDLEDIFSLLIEEIVEELERIREKLLLIREKVISFTTARSTMAIQLTFA